MRRIIAAALVAALALAVMPATASAYSNNYTKGQRQDCRFARNGRYSVSESRDTFRCTYRRIAPGKVRVARRIISRESGWRTRARNPSSTAGGLLQSLIGTWHSVCRHFKEVRRRWGFGRSCNRFNARHALVLGATHMKRWGTDAWSLTR